MKKTLLFLACALVFALHASGQFIDYPAGYDGKPEARLKGPVHTVLTIEQREEHVFATTVETYDEKGRLIESLSSNANTEVHSGQLVRLGGKTTYIFDSSGRAIRRSHFDPEGDLTGYDTKTYDKEGRLIEESLFDKDGKDRGYTRYTYASDKREVELTWLFRFPNTRDSPMRSILTYDEKGRWTSRKMFLSGNDVVKFEYDGDGNFVKEIHSGFGNTYKYKFDKYGNWIERINSYFQDDGKSESPNWMNEYRIITYYPEQKVGAK